MKGLSDLLREYNRTPEPAELPETTPAVMKSRESRESRELITADGTGLPAQITIPADTGQTAPELLEQVAPSFIRACLDMANDAIAGRVDPTKMGDLPHKVTLMLLHKVVPARKWADTAPDETPAELKLQARALKSIIKSITEDGEVVVNATSRAMRRE